MGRKRKPISCIDSSWNIYMDTVILHSKPIYMLYHFSHQCKAEYELFIFLLQSTIVGSYFGIQIKAVNVYVSVHSQLNLRGTLYAVKIIDFCIKYSNTLSFELLKHSLWPWAVPPGPYPGDSMLFWKSLQSSPVYTPACYVL